LNVLQLFAGVGISVFYALGTIVAWRNLAILGMLKKTDSYRFVKIENFSFLEVQENVLMVFL